MNLTLRRVLLGWVIFMCGLPMAPAALAQTRAANPSADAPPAFAVRDVPEVFFGTSVPDPYRALEDKTAPEVVQWMKAQDQHARDLLARIPGRAGLVERLLRYDAAVSARVVGVTRETGDLWLYQRRGADENQFKLYQRRGLKGAERLLVDPEAAEKLTGKPHAINYFSAAPGGRKLAYGLSAQGSEDAALHVIDGTGKALAGPISRANYGGVSWAGDGRRLLFNRLQAMTPGLPETEKFQRSQVLLWDTSQPIERARSVFGIGTPGVDIGPAEAPYASFTSDGRWVLGYIANGTQSELGLYVSPAPAVLAGKPRWRKLFGPEAAVVGVAYHHHTLYLRSHLEASRFKILRLNLNQPSIAQATLLAPAGDKVITNLAAASDGLYVEMRDGNVKRLFKRAWGRAKPLTEIALPMAGSFNLSDDETGISAGDPRLPGLVHDLQSWTRARQIHVINASGRVRNSGLQPAGAFDAPADLVATEVSVKSHDGALVPMSIIHRKGLALDGRNPVLLTGYASYGTTEEPYFSTGRLAFIEAGGVVAVANPRGSSVVGQDWYRAGFQATKPNTWKDFIACAEWLIAQRYTAPDKLGIPGGSAGGILVGMAMVERPDLFASVVSSVGALDMLRAELTPNGVSNIPEFGSRATEAGFRALLAMSTYHQIRDGTRYPAVLLTHGVNDPRVEVWMSTKTGARLQAASSSGKPVLLRLDWDAGHGVGNTKRQQIEERADIYAFMLWQAGVAGYQPR